MMVDNETISALWDSLRYSDISRVQLPKSIPIFVYGQQD